MLYFGVPLKSRRVAVNWDHVMLLFNRTLRSLFNQTSPDFRVIVACHELPTLEQPFDDRLEFLQVDSPLPQNLREQMCDRGYKVHAIGKRIRELGGGYTMIVDADDLVSRRLAAFVNRAPVGNGWSIDTGYMYYLDVNTLRYAPKFPGRTAIVNYRVEDLPDSMEGAWCESSREQPHLIRKGHGNIADVCREIGRPLKRLPFKAFVYVLGTGDNHSTLNGRRSRYRALLDRLIPPARLSPSVRREFSMTWLDSH